MSALVYGELTRSREDAPVNSPLGVGTYVDALAALVPAEILGLHAVILSFTTQTVKNSDGEAVTTITEPETLSWVFWVLLILSVVLYLGTHLRNGTKQWNKLDFVRMLIPPFAFVFWTMLQKSTAFDAIAPDFGQVPRDAIAVIGAVILGLVVAWLASRADQTPSPT